MSEKRYYWLKLHEHFFDRAVIKYLRKLPNGETIVLIYLELLCISLCSDGYVYTDGLYDSMEEDLALVLGEEVMTVRLALSALEAAKLITRGGGAADFYMKEYPEMVGSEAASTRRSRELRTRRKQTSVALQQNCNAGATLSNVSATKCNIDIDKDIDIDIDKELEKDTDIDKEGVGPPVAFGIYRNVYLTSPELESLRERFPDSYLGKIDHLSAYLKSTDRKYANHYLTIVRWDERAKKERESQKKPGFPDYSKVKEGESY